MKQENIKTKVDSLLARWQGELGDNIEVILGGSLVSGLFIIDEETTVIDVDVHFLVDNPQDPRVQKRIEAITGLSYRKTITVSDWPEGSSKGVMVEGVIELPELSLPLEVEGCIRNPHYIGWGRFYREVLTTEEINHFLKQKKELRHDKAKYKKLKQKILGVVKDRCLKKGLVSK